MPVYQDRYGMPVIADDSIFGPRPPSNKQTPNVSRLLDRSGGTNGYLPYANLPSYLQDFLEGQGSDLGLRANFFARVGQQGPQTANYDRYASNQYQPYLDKYLGKLGGQALEGNDPTLSWTDFLNSEMQGFQQNYLRSPVQQTGRQVGGLAGNARWLVNF